MLDSMPRFVVSILGLGHSGTTVLGHFLGAHPAALHIGELTVPVRRGHPIKCHFCEDEPCPIWGSAIQEADLYRAYRSHQLASLPGMAPLVHRLSNVTGLLASPGALYQKVFDSYPNLDVIIDSSKDLHWARWNSRAATFKPVILLMIRDLRAVTASYLRREPASVAATAELHARSLKRLMRRLDHLQGTTVIRVRYEELIADPESVGRDICRAVGLPYRNEMASYYRYPQHIIGGNRGPTLELKQQQGRGAERYLSTMHPADRPFYRRATPGFRPDRRWREEMTPAMLMEFEVAAGDFNRSLGYGE